MGTWLLSINGSGGVASMLGAVLTTALILAQLTLLDATEPDADKPAPPTTNAFYP